MPKRQVKSWMRREATSRAWLSDPVMDSNVPVEQVFVCFLSCGHAVVCPAQDTAPPKSIQCYRCVRRK